MTHTIVDRRKNGKGKSVQNRQRFLKRIKSRVSDTMKDAVKNGKIADVINGSKSKVNVPIDDIHQPTFHHSSHGGISRRVLPYNQKFIKGDRIPRPESQNGSGNGNGAGDGEGGEDSFSFSLTRDEFLDYFFSDLELPELVNKNINIVEEYKVKRSGYSSDGNPARLDILQSMKQATGRRFALSGKKRKELRELRNQLVVINNEWFTLKMNTSNPDLEQLAVLELKRDELNKEIEKLRGSIHVPYIDDMDLRYRQWTIEAVPASQAVMFCLMDVSGSMTEMYKELAKRFFMLLYLFLHRNYDRIEIVFIRHHSYAEEVDEDTFFNSRETGGTLVSQGLEMVIKIAKERYDPTLWNRYVAHASDGDSWSNDSDLTREHFKTLASMVQYYFYIETTEESRTHHTSDLLQLFKEVNPGNFDYAHVCDPTQIFPVFEGLFEKRSSK